MYDWATKRAQRAIAPILKERIHGTLLPKDYDAAWDAVGEALRQVARECVALLEDSACGYDTISKAKFIRECPESADWHREVAQELLAHVAMIRLAFPLEEK